MPALSKPLSEFVTLDKHLSPRGIHFDLPAGTIIVPEDKKTEDYTLVISQGSVSINRNPGNIMFGMSQSPAIFGLVGAIMKIQQDYTITTESDCRGYYLPVQDTLHCLTRYQLWREALYWVTWQHRMLEIRDAQLIGSSNYQQIRSTLLVMAKWNDNLRARVGVMRFIQHRTNISRSVIAEVLSALRKGNYIQMEKGKLVSITRLPYDY